MTDDTSSPSRSPADRPLLVCLLPARNAAHDLPAYLDNVSRFCDAVVALDDGSTDATPDQLADHPLVKVLLRNDRREDYRGWDDAANRNRLLAAAADLNPHWLISLDADERFDARDATSLRQLLETDALPGCVYGFRHVQMRQDAEHFEPRYQWVYRLFSAAHGQRFPAQRLHFIPIPTSLPRSRWIKTTLRIQHFGGQTAERRIARFAKYLEADPQRTYQAEYGHLLAADAREDLRRWQPRPASVPVLLASDTFDDPTRDDGALSDDTDQAALSAIIIAQNNEATIARTVASVVNQEVPDTFEVILVASGHDRTAAIVRRDFPTVTVIELPRPALPGEARNAGLAVARGEFISFPGSHVELLPGSLAARLRAHRRGYAMVTGVTTNGTPTAAGWASYFLDHAEGLPGQAPAELNGPPAHCSYARLPLLEVGGFPDGVRTGEDTEANRALVERGYVAFRDPAVQLVHRSRCTTVGRLLKHHFQRGRGWGRMLVSRHRAQGRLVNRTVIRGQLIEAVPRRLTRIAFNTSLARGDITAQYQRVRTLVALGAAASWLGMWFEILRPTPGKSAVLFGHPMPNLLIISLVDGPRLALAQIDHVARDVTIQPVPAGQEAPAATSISALVDLVGQHTNKPDARSLTELREVIGDVFNVPNLGCLIDEGMGLVIQPMLSGGQDAALTASRPWSSIRNAAIVIRELRRGRLRSTLPLWETISAVERLRRSTSA